MSWWRRLWRRDRMEADLDKELRFHLDQQAADLIARGHDPAEARRQTRLAFGGPEQVKEECRDARGTRWLEDLLQDLRYALRSLRLRPAFAAIAILTLALGAGATTVMFTIINGVLLKPLPYPQPDRLVKLDEQTKGIAHYRWGDRWAFSYPNFLDCQRDTRSLAVAGWRYSGGTISGAGDPERVDAFEISPNLFSVLGVPLLRGRAFQPAEDRPAAAPVAIISYDLWQRRFASNLAAVGSQLTFEGKPYTIVGIAPPTFRFEDADVFTPLGQDTRGYMQARDAHPGINAVGRIEPGASLAQAQAELDLIGRRLAGQYPKSNAGRGFIAEPLRPDAGDVRSTLWLLLGAVTLVLLIACANVASLLLARAISRERELAMRVALGAGRGRLVRQCLTESCVLGLAGGACGVFLATLAIRPFIAFWPGSLPRASEVAIDWRVMLFALAVSFASGMLFGLAPALRAATRVRTVSAARRLHRWFVICEIALAMVLLVSAGMLGRTLLALSSVDPGINIHQVLTARMALSPSTLAHPDRIRAAWQDILDQARRVPGVESIALVDTVPMRSGDNELGYWTTPAEPQRDQKPLALANSVTPDYFNVMQIPLRRGRLLNDNDRQGTELVVVIDELLARHAFGNDDPIGKRIWTDLVPNPLRVVGVVGHVRHWGLAADDQAHVRDQFYYAFAQVPDTYLRRWSELMSIAVRTAIPPSSLVEPLRRELRGTGGDQVLYAVHILEQLARDTLARQRFLLVLFAAFAALALLLACVGIYGVMSYVTSRRVPEIGVRMALGARPGDVVHLVLRQSLAIVAIGVAIGALAALAAGHLLERLVIGMRPGEPMTFVAMSAVLMLAATAASFVPARRASRIDPMAALRQE